MGEPVTGLNVAPHPSRNEADDAKAALAEIALIEDRAVSHVLMVENEKSSDLMVVLRGTVGAARTDNPDTANSQFYIVADAVLVCVHACHSFVCQSARVRRKILAKHVVHGELGVVNFFHLGISFVQIKKMHDTNSDQNSV